MLEFGQKHHARAVVVVAHGGKSKDLRRRLQPAPRGAADAPFQPRSGPSRTGLEASPSPSCATARVGFNEGDPVEDLPGRSIAWPSATTRRSAWSGHSMGARAAAARLRAPGGDRGGGAGHLDHSRGRRGSGGRAQRHAGPRSARPGHRPGRAPTPWRCSCARPAPGHAGSRSPGPVTPCSTADRCGTSSPARFAFGALGLEPMESRIAEAFDAPADVGCRVLV